MSIWSTIGGIALGAVGAGLEFVPGAQGLGTGLISAGAGLVGKGIQSDQVSKAANKQQQATNQAIDVATPVYNQTRQNLDPYIALGNGAVGNLRGLAGLSASQPGQNVAPMASKPGQVALGTPNYVQVPGLLEGAYKAMAEQRGTGYVQMQGPDGTVKQVPLADADYWLQNGGKLVREA